MPDKVALELASQISNQNLSKEGWTTYYVDGTNGNNGANGLTWNSAFATIQHAVDTAKSWAKIFIKNGSYTESVDIPITANGIQIIGENRYNTKIVLPTDGYIVLNGANCKIQTLTVDGVTNAPHSSYNPTVRLQNIGCRVTDVYLIGDNGNWTTAGILIWADDCEVDNIISENHSDSIICYGLSTDPTLRSKIHDCQLFNGYTGVYFDLTSSYCRFTHIYDVFFESFTYGVFAPGANSIINTIYHNNFSVGITIFISSSSASNKAYENFYNGWTTDTNNDGICDTPKTLTGITDYSPVPSMDGWKRDSRGNVAGSSIAEIEANIGDFQAQTNLRTILAALGIPDVAGKPLYTTLITDRLDNATYGLSAIETLVYDLETRLTAVRAGYLDELAAANLPADIDIIKADTQTIEDATLKAAPTAGSLSRFIASGGTALGTQLPDSKSLYDVVVVDRLSGAETVGSYNLPNDLVENTAIEIITGSRQKLESIWLDFVNLVQNVTIKVYHKIDGTNYRQYDTYYWVTTDEDGVLIKNLTINNAWKLTITSEVAQGAIMAIPYNIIKTPME